MCGAPASRTQRLIGGRPVILVGGSESYKTRRRDCYEVRAEQK